MLLDLICVVDGSDSITSGDFSTLRTTVAHLVDLFPIGQGEGRMGIVVYSSNIAFQMPMTFDADLVRTKAQTLPHPMDGTATYLGIAEMRKIFMSDERRITHRDVPAVGLVLTDGRSKNMTRTIAQAKLARDQGVEVRKKLISFGLRIGTHSVGCLHNIFFFSGGQINISYLRFVDRCNVRLYVETLG